MPIGTNLYLKMTRDYIRSKSTSNEETKHTTTTNTTLIVPNDCITLYQAMHNEQQ